MEPANLKVIKDWQKSQNRASLAKEVPIAKSDEQMIPEPIPVRKGLHLDVDKILKRSLPKVSTPGS